MNAIALTPLNAYEKNLCEEYAQRWPRLDAVARQVCRGYYNSLIKIGFANEDIHGIAWTGVLRAAQKFRVDKGATFATYAAIWIKAMIRRAVDDSTRQKRTPTQGQSFVRPDGFPSGGGWESVACPKISTAERQERLSEIAMRIQQALSLLTPRQRKILELRHGFNDQPHCTLQEVGEILNLTRERIRQLESQAMQEIRPLLAHYCLDLVA